MRGDEFLDQVSARPPFNRMHPSVAAFFKEYLAKEKVIRFDGKYVVNTHFPPYPSGAFDNLVEQFNRLGDVTDRRLYSVTLAVTNRCPYDCWHCYNAGRSQTDLPLDVMRRLVEEMTSLGAVKVNLTGGEPLLRGDLEQIAGCFHDQTFLTLGTTGAGLTADRAGRLRDNGLFAVGVSLDSTDEALHDRLRGRKGAFRTALAALEVAAAAGLYPYVVSVATREYLQEAHFRRFIRFAGNAGALEVHLLEPSATGKLAGRDDVLLSKAERQLIFDYQHEVADDETLPVLSSFAYLESSDAFGCGAGLTHLYVDGGGEVCPCNLVPTSFGNVLNESLSDILDRMGGCFCRPRAQCVGKTLGRYIPDGALPTSPQTTAEICQKWLPEEHAVPRFFQLRSAATPAVGREELQAAYDDVHEYYDDFWLTEAARPIDDLVERLRLQGTERVFEAGCGTGFATAALARRTAEVLAIDLSDGMLGKARQRLDKMGLNNVRFLAGDALQVDLGATPFDLVFSSWVLGYIPLTPFFDRARGVLNEGGRLAFVLHKDNSPKRELDIFAELVAADPTVLQRRVAFDFPEDADQIADLATAAGYRIDEIWEGAAVFRYETPRDVLEHLLKSGAGTAFHDAIDPARREALTGEFLRVLAERNETADRFAVRHDFVGCIATRR